MNRIRSIKPEIRRNRKIADCGLLATLLSRDLITYADDQGRFHASVREIKAECFPYHDSLKLAEIEEALLALADVGFIELYVVEGAGTVEYKRPPDVQNGRVPKVQASTERFGWIPGWFRHQQLKADRVTWSELPPPPTFEPRQMSKALYARWLEDGANGELPPRGDGSLSVPNRLRVGTGSEADVSNLETNRGQAGDTVESNDSVLEPRARRRAGAERTGPERIGTEHVHPPNPPEGAVHAVDESPAEAIDLALRVATRHEAPIDAAAIELIRGYQELGYAQPSATDIVKASEFLAELRYLTVAEMLERMRGHLAWCEQEGRPRPQSLGGFWNTLRSENDYRRDNGARARDAPGRSPTGVVGIGDVLRVLPQVGQA